jgi:hypothetical protein
MASNENHLYGVLATDLVSLLHESQEFPTPNEEVDTPSSPLPPPRALRHRNAAQLWLSSTVAVAVSPLLELPAAAPAPSATRPKLHLYITRKRVAPDVLPFGLVGRIIVVTIWIHNRHKTDTMRQQLHVCATGV